MHCEQKNISLRAFLLTACLLLTGLAGCDNKEDEPMPEPVDRNRIGYIIQDNFTLSVCAKVLTLTGVIKKVTDSTRYTFLTPNDKAFELIGAGTYFPYAGFTEAWLSGRLNYAALKGAVAFRDLPLGVNQPLPSANGFRAYVSRYRRNNDTITTVNGMRVLQADVKASNGFLQVTGEVAHSENYGNVALFLLNDTSYTLFALAAERSGLMQQLRSGEKTFTVLAPLNSVMRTYGAIRPGLNLTSPDSILAADPTALANLLQYHITEGRYFLDRLQDHLLTSPDPHLTMLNGQQVLVRDNGSGYNAVTFTGEGNSSPVNIFRYFTSPYYNTANYPAGNGVVHGIGGILLP
ncbi:fasciclin domain-containing protein [Chitinophaga barathri]|uniref:Fasciclin domain-containing protein n=1 Tax=Chitinophaga barathri TaxID=1647451 RepID=A0A3N4MCX9_9BACT|nr:fasciclin domain-containing protein [Chitinophaga barathri]RPD39397.1 fasciclin domain-containing protein [Chitinophaga barathri]